MVQPLEPKDDLDREATSPDDEGTSNRSDAPKHPSGHSKRSSASAIRLAMAALVLYFTWGSSTARDGKEQGYEPTSALDRELTTSGSSESIAGSVRKALYVLLQPYWTLYVDYDVFVLGDVPTGRTDDLLELYHGFREAIPLANLRDAKFVEFLIEFDGNQLSREAIGAEGFRRTHLEGLIDSTRNAIGELDAIVLRYGPGLSSNLEEAIDELVVDKFARSVIARRDSVMRSLSSTELQPFLRTKGRKPFENFVKKCERLDEVLALQER